jgi:hypothetical protein
MKRFKHVVLAAGLLATSAVPLLAQTNTPSGVTGTISSGAGSAFDTGVTVFVVTTSVTIAIGFVLKGLMARKR